MVGLSELERIERGREARRLLDHPLLQEAFLGVEAGIVAQWKSALEAPDRERLWAGLHGARRVEIFIRAMADDGALAQRAAEEAAQEQQ